MRVVDVLLAFPPLLFLLVLVTGAGTSPRRSCSASPSIHVPGIARIVRSAALEVSVRGYVEAAVARGEPHARRSCAREILPNISGTIVADGGLRFTVSILLVAASTSSASGLQPPAADWALMIAENRPASRSTSGPWSRRRS